MPLPRWTVGRPSCSDRLSAGLWLAASSTILRLPPSPLAHRLRTWREQKRRVESGVTESWAKNCMEALGCPSPGPPSRSSRSSQEGRRATRSDHDWAAGTAGEIMSSLSNRLRGSAPDLFRVYSHSLWSSGPVRETDAPALRESPAALRAGFG